MISPDIGMVIAAFLTFCVFSYFIKADQNIFFRFAQSTLIGIALGYIISIVIVKNVSRLAFSQISQGNLIFIIPVVLGLAMYSSFIPKYKYIARYPIAIVISVGLAVSARASLETKIYKHILASAERLIIGVPILQAIDNSIFLIATITTICYFFFTYKPEEHASLKYLSATGKFFLMVYFGTQFATVITSRLTLLLSRVQFILVDWLGVI